MGSTSHTGTGSHGKGWAQEPCTHQSTQGCLGGGFFLCPSGQGAIKHQEVPFPHQFRANFLSRNQGVRLPWAARPPLCHQTHSHSPCHRNPFTKSNVRASPLQPAEPPSRTPASLLRLWQPLPNNLHNAKHTWPPPAGAEPPNPAQTPPQAAPSPSLALPAARDPFHHGRSWVRMAHLHRDPILLAAPTLWIMSGLLPQALGQLMGEQRFTEIGKKRAFCGVMALVTTPAPAAMPQAVLIISTLSFWGQLLQFPSVSGSDFLMLTGKPLQFYPCFC